MNGFMFFRACKSIGYTLSSTIYRSQFGFKTTLSQKCFSPSLRAGSHKACCKVKLSIEKPVNNRSELQTKKYRWLVNALVDGGILPARNTY